MVFFAWMEKIKYQQFWLDAGRGFPLSYFLQSFMSMVFGVFLHLYALKHTMKSTQQPFHASTPVEITLKQQILAVN